jgi:hypothetical protein
MDSAALTLFLGVLLALDVQAQETSPTGAEGPALEEVIVTASKRVSTLQDTPRVHRYVPTVARVWSGERTRRRQVS